MLGELSLAVVLEVHVHARTRVRLRVGAVVMDSDVPSRRSAVS